MLTIGSRKGIIMSQPKYPFIDKAIDDFVVWLGENIIVFGFPTKISAQEYVNSLPLGES